MAIIDDAAAALNDIYGWTITSVDPVAKTITVDDAGAVDVLAEFTWKALVKDDLRVQRILTLKQQLEAALLARINTFEQKTGLSPSTVALTTNTDAQGVTTTTAVTVQIDKVFR